ncbi:MAG: polysaccharide deacetylase family protein [bacterium]|nr:polysaccharide deacetylase family protein [bacterium]
MSEPTPQERWRPVPLVRLSAVLHAACFVGLAWSPARWPLWGGLMLLDHLALLVASLSPRSRLLGANLTRMPASLVQDGEVALTFDDGPDPEVTPRVLDLLDRYAARASFFCIGRRAQQYPEIVAEIVRRGHRVENHTFRHTHAFAFHGVRALGREIDRAQEVLERLSGRRPVLFRAPAGMRNPLLDPVLARRRLRLVSWTRRGFDAVEKDPAKVTRRLLKGLVAGDILLLHDGSATRDRRGRVVVLEALPPLLDQMKAQGLRSIPLPATGWGSEGGG